MRYRASYTVQLHAHIHAFINYLWAKYFRNLYNSNHFYFFFVEIEYTGFFLLRVFMPTYERNLSLYFQ